MSLETSKKFENITHAYLNKWNRLPVCSNKQEYMYKVRRAGYSVNNTVLEHNSCMVSHILRTWKGM